MRASRSAQALNKSVANKIVREIKSIFPYDVSIMDTFGVVIASSRQSRIGEIDQISLRCVRYKNIIEEEGTDQGSSVSIPLWHGSQVAGVVGIGGPLEEARMCIQLVRIASELMIDQIQFKYKSERKQSIGGFISEWTWHKNEYSPALIKKGEEIKIDITLPYFAVLVSGLEDAALALKIIREELGMSEYWFSPSASSHMIAMHEDKNLLKRMRRLSSAVACKIGIGKPMPTLHESFMQAREAIRIGSVLYPQKSIFLYAEYGFIHALERLGNLEMRALIAKLEDEGKSMQLLETVRAFIENNGCISDTCQQLYIHRNTLKYRLDKIHDITDKNPRSYLDIFYLYVALIQYLLSQKQNEF